MAGEFSDPYGRLLVRMARYLLDPGRLLFAALRRTSFGSFETRCALDLFPRPHYAYGLQQAAHLAQRLGIPAISAVEFGVAGGRGLVTLEQLAARTQRATGIRIDLYGFDRATGLPKPTDYRDLPYTWKAGDFTMDIAALRRRLSSASLVLGDIEQTVPSFFEEHKPAPVGFVAVDVDYYSSAAAALRLFRADHAFFLPRVFCYFDDVVGDDDQVIHNEYVGELCAIREFNEENAGLKLAPIHGLRHKRPIPAPWNDSFYALHRFGHPQYADYVGPEAAANQLPVD